MKLRTWLLAGLCMSQTAVYAVSAANDPQKDIDALKAELVQYESRDALGRYHAYKAKMWLSYALNEWSEGSLTPAGQEALQQAQQLASSLAEGKELSLTTPILSVSQVMRRDLWQQAEFLKQQGAIEQAPESLAQAEVMLVWAAAEYCELGWRHANEPFRAAEQSLYQTIEASKIQAVNMHWDADAAPSLAELNGKGCNGVNAKLWPLNQKNEQVQAEAVKVQNVVHFALDRTELSVASQSVLNQLIHVMKQYPQINVQLLGYTDSRASQAYNLKLAERRTQAVQQYLMTQGIDANRIRSAAKGAQELQTDANMQMAHAKSRRVVIEMNEVGQIKIEPQWLDLQIESEQKKSEGELK